MKNLEFLTKIMSFSRKKTRDFDFLEDFIFFCNIKFEERYFTLQKLLKKSSDTLSFTENSGKALRNFEFLGKFSLSFRKILSFIPLSFGEIVQIKSLAYL